MPIWFAEVSYDDWILYEKKDEKKSVYPPGEVNWQVLGLAKRILIFSVTDVALRAWVVLLVSDLFNLQAQWCPIHSVAVNYAVEQYYKLTWECPHSQLHLLSLFSGNCQGDLGKHPISFQMWQIQVFRRRCADHLIHFIYIFCFLLTDEQHFVFYISYQMSNLRWKHWEKK